MGRTLKKELLRDFPYFFNVKLKAFLSDKIHFKVNPNIFKSSMYPPNPAYLIENSISKYISFNLILYPNSVSTLLRCKTTTTAISEHRTIEAHKTIIKHPNLWANTKKSTALPHYSCKCYSAHHRFT